MAKQPFIIGLRRIGDRRKSPRHRLLRRRPLLEAETLDLLGEYGIATPARGLAETLEEAIAAADRIGYPVALKTAEGHAHKTERRGVALGLENSDALARSYAELSRRLGPRVLVQAMAEPGVEIALGAVDDPQFGPFVMVAAGGSMIELIGASFKATAGTHQIGATFLATNFAPLLDLDKHFMRSTVQTGPTPGYTFFPHVGTLRIEGPFNATAAKDSPSRRKIFVCTPKTASEETAPPPPRLRRGRVEARKRSWRAKTDARGGSSRIWRLTPSVVLRRRPTSAS